MNKPNLKGGGVTSPFERKPKEPGVVNRHNGSSSASLAEIIEHIQGMKKEQKNMGVRAVVHSWEKDPEMYFYNKGLDDALSYLHSIQKGRHENFRYH